MGKTVTGIQEELTGTKVNVPSQTTQPVTTMNAPSPVNDTPGVTKTASAPVQTTQVIDDKTMTEIKRKADAGIALYDPTEAKLKAYNDYLATKNPAPTPAPTGVQATNPSMNDLEGYAKGNADAQYANQEAMLGQARDKQIADLERAYADAVEQGTLSVREAEEQFRKQTEVINQQAYRDGQVTDLTAESRGIQNSQQMIGLMQGDNARKNTMINENMTTRDKRIADIGDRIKNLSTKKGIDIANANANYNYGLAGAKAQSDAQFNQAMFGLKQSDYEAYRNQGFTEKNMATQQGYTQDNMRLQQDFDIEKLDIQQQNVLAQMATQFGYDIKKMDKQQIYQLAQMAKQHGYNMTMQNDQQAFQNTQGNKEFERNKWLQNDQQSHQVGMQDDAQSHDSAMLDKQFGFDMSKLATQHGYSMAEISAQGQNQLKSIGAQAEAERKAYEQAMDRELAKYSKDENGNPNTPEGKIVQEQWKQKMAEAEAEIQGKAQLEAKVLFMKENYGDVKNPKKPLEPNWFEKLFTPFGSHDKKLEQYKTDKEKYDAYQRYLKTGKLPGEK